MIDIENIVVDKIITSVGSSAKVSSEYLAERAEFPYVYIRELDNQTLQTTQDNSLNEHHAEVRYRIEIYSNLQTGAKSQCRSLLQTIDSAMASMKFTRTNYNFVPNFSPSIKRLIADYRAIVQAPKAVGTDTIYQMYR